MKRDFFRAVESALFSFPALIRQLTLREEYIMAKCDCFDGFIKPGSSGSVLSIEDRVVAAKERDPEYQLLLAKTKAIKQAFKSLPANLRQLVVLYYFEQLPREVVMEEMAISEREFYRQRRKAVEKCAPFILGPFGM